MLRWNNSDGAIVGWRVEVEIDGEPDRFAGHGRRLTRHAQHEQANGLDARGACGVDTSMTMRWCITAVLPRSHAGLAVRATFTSTEKREGSSGAIAPTTPRYQYHSTIDRG